MAGLLWSAAPAAALSGEASTISLSGEGSVSGLYPCTCAVTFPVLTSSGQVEGVSGTTPFTVSWDAPGLSSASLSMEISANCGIPDAPPTIVNLAGILTISNAVMVYNGVKMPASVSASFNAAQIADSAITVHLLDFTATSGSTSVSLSITLTNGLLNLVPTADDICPNVVPMTFAVNGTLASEL